MDEKLGKYIVIEGTDGAGTTTQKDILKQALIIQGQRTIAVAEPGGTAIGDQLRLIIKNGSLDRSPDTNMDLFAICRRELAEQVIGPNISSGINVVSDRNWFSTVAYQGFGEGLETSEITERMQKVLGKYFLPDIVMIIDVPVEVSEARIKNRGIEVNDTFEQKGRTFFEKVREGYLWLAAKYDIPIIDGTMVPEDVHAVVLSIVESKT